MAQIAFVRIDFRLIHGQVITRWLKQTNADRILVIDNKLAEDPFMSQVYVMAAPPGVQVEMISIEDAVEAWERDKLGKGKLLVLFKTVKTALDIVEKGFPLEKLQVGGLGAGPGRKVVYNQITLDQKDADYLQLIQNKGTEVFFQTVPEETPASLEKIIKKL
jgi:D-glucosaminate-specific PTS system IIB component